MRRATTTMTHTPAALPTARAMFWWAEYPTTNATSIATTNRICAHCEAGHVGSRPVQSRDHARASQPRLDPESPSLATIENNFPLMVARWRVEWKTGPCLRPTRPTGQTGRDG